MGSQICYNTKQMEKAESYLGLNNKYLEEAEVLSRKGDWVQASEKFWVLLRWLRL